MIVAVISLVAELIILFMEDNGAFALLEKADTFLYWFYFAGMLASAAGIVLSYFWQHRNSELKGAVIGYICGGIAFLLGFFIWLMMTRSAINAWIFG